MRRILHLFLALTLLLTVGCKKDDDATLDVGNTQLTCDSSVLLQTIQVRCDDIWRAESNVWWCAPLKKSGKGDASLPVWVSPNLTNTQREGKITIRTGNVSRTVNIVQPAYNGNTDDYVCHLPVVFHILYKDQNDEQQNVRKGQMARILDEVNKLYEQNQMNIVFELARYNDEGEELEEPGVVRHEVTFDDYSPYEFLSNTNTDNQQYAKFAQNMKRYINVYVFTFKESNDGSSTMGVSDLPVMPSAHPLDSLQTTDKANGYAYMQMPWGCFINNKFIYEWEDENTYNPYYIVTTMAHELGHYIGLLHAFSLNECEEDDACEDTPVCDYMNYVSYTAEYIRKQKELGVKTFKMSDLARRYDCKTLEEYTAHNIMDYMYCYNDQFTPQQFSRTRQVLLYSPLVPGPKLAEYNTDGTETRGINIPITPHITPCPTIRPTGPIRPIRPISPISPISPTK